MDNDITMIGNAPVIIDISKERDAFGKIRIQCVPKNKDSMISKYTIFLSNDDKLQLIDILSKIDVKV